MPSSPSPSPSPSPPSSSAAAVTAASSDLPMAVVLATPSPAAAALATPSNNPSPPVRRGLPPPCWTDDETLALIDSYREKWYSLRRGNLRAAHWDEVAEEVRRRSASLPASTPKTSVQCRHKIEKLRKRYRSERQRSLNHNPHVPPASPWIFFSKMDHMENPNPVVPNPNRYNQDHLLDSEDDDEDDDEVEPMFQRRPQVVANGGGSSGIKFKIPKAVRTSRAVPMGIPINPINPTPSSAPSSGKGTARPMLEEMRRKMEAKRRREMEEEEQEEDNNKGFDAMGEMVRALRVLGDGYVRMEQMKMEMAREIERTRMEMELKRTEMVLDTQRRIVETFVNGVRGDKKLKRSAAPDS